MMNSSRIYGSERRFTRSWYNQLRLHFALSIQNYEYSFVKIGEKR